MSQGQNDKVVFPVIVGDEWPMKEVASTQALTSSLGGWPKVSIITPSYNQGEFLEKTIRSVLLQNYPNLEYIIIDGGSTDNSVEIIKKYEPWLTYWVSEKDRGQSHAINKGFEKSSGELLGWLNSDDYFTSGALYRVASEYLQDKSVGAVFGQGHIVDKIGKFIRDTALQQVDHQSLSYWFEGGAEFMQPSCFFTREAWERCGPLSEDLHYAMDLDLWLKISKQFKFNKIDDLLSYSVRHEGAKTSGRNFAKVKIDIAFAYSRNGNELMARDFLIKQFEQMNVMHNELSYLSKSPFLRKILRFLVKWQEASTS